MKQKIKFAIKLNWMYIAIFLICIAIMLFGILEEEQFFRILQRALFENGYKEHYFANVENANELINIAPTVWNIMKYSVSNYHLVLDTNIILGTTWFQIVIPFFSLVGGITFYNHFHKIDRMRYFRKNKYRSELLKVISKNALKVSCAVFFAYLIFTFFIYSLATPGQLGAEGRTFLQDILGPQFYTNHTLLYFLLEGSVRFLLIPFTYTIFVQSIVLLEKSVKEVMLAPIVYYYGLSAVGYALYSFAPTLSLYINPSVIMASGSYDSFNSILLILINSIPLFLGILLITKETSHANL